jgi:glycine dehydrogenase
MTDAFVRRHVGPGAEAVRTMLSTLGLNDLDELVEAVVPASIRLDRPLDLPAARDEVQALADLSGMAGTNQVLRTYLGAGYHDTITPPVILRNILENPGWYTAYTPYQAEIAQGRLEALLVFQMVVQDLTGFEVSNASLLDEATAAAEAMTMAKRVARKNKSTAFFAAEDCHPQTLAVVRTRAEALGYELVVGDPETFDFDATPVFGVLVQMVGTGGEVHDHRAFAQRAHDAGALVIAAVDLLALAVIAEPVAWADIAIGSSQRFGVPLGYGGPHAAFLATDGKKVRKMPGRIIGVSRDRHDNTAFRMALQTREQHIRRDKATSNVCTAQVLLAVCAGMYAVWHGPEGVRAIAERVRAHTATLSASLQAAGFALHTTHFFDTITVAAADRQQAIVDAALRSGINLRAGDDGTVSIAFDETVSDADVDDVLAAFGATRVATEAPPLPDALVRRTPYLTHRVFSAYHSETEMLRYLHRLQSKDLSLTAAMIPLGSCTMKLNATTEMAPVTMAGFGKLHPFAPTEQARGYAALHDDLEAWLAEITGFAAISLQPNAGSQGEYAGLLVIRAYHESRGDAHRDICLIPHSAHGTNPASAVMAGMRVVEVGCDDEGNIDVDDLERLAAEHADELAALMVTYPSTHGVFEQPIRQVCEIVHAHGGQVYMDGANLNAMVGLCRPGDIGADVCHLNLHKTFCIPHGGGGPGMGPIGVAAHLAPFRPGHPTVDLGVAQAIGPVSAAPWGSPSILPISWAYIAMMGPEGLAHASKVAILSANYIAKRLEGHFQVLYTGENGLVAHECILDCRPFKASAGVSVDDIAKRLQDYGFHGPTMSWPVSGTLMVEPTESESLAEVDRFCDAMIAIRDEIRDLEEGRADPADNPLGNAPHTVGEVGGDTWTHPYTRAKAAWPAEGLRRFKFWPTVGRVDNVYGDKNLRTALGPDEAS